MKIEQVVCKKCLGRGHDEGKKRCDACGGTGLEKQGHRGVEK